MAEKQTKIPVGGVRIGSADIVLQGTDAAFRVTVDHVVEAKDATAALLWTMIRQQGALIQKTEEVRRLLVGEDPGPLQALAKSIEVGHERMATAQADAEATVEKVMATVLRFIEPLMSKHAAESDGEVRRLQLRGSVEDVAPATGVVVRGVPAAGE